ncbi:hypothetical protein NQ315_010741 [Exocentrus adspersus]|uniref:Cilia- and flagella-associated protein 263 n=1 Tax=Exocentrus adspersus TaxID=1586481 RepID=A0AAV8VUT4_9CUCU|nr:hypothetical protein NQ315_010741 [Exocentrus adspersus]
MSSTSSKQSLSECDAVSLRESEVTQKKFLERLSDNQLIQAVNDKARELRHLRLENQVFFNYLKDNEPAEVEGFDNLVKFAEEKAWVKKAAVAKIPTTSYSEYARGSVSSRRSVRYESFSSVCSIFEGKGPKLNQDAISDMVMKAMEETQSNLEILLKKSQRLRRNLNAELEEFILREKDIKESKDSFEFNVMIQAMDPLTQRIPAEKFVRWMEEWLKSAQLNIEKLRLRTASLKIQARKVSAILLQRQELGENVHAVDFDQLEIENKHFAKKIRPEESATHRKDLHNLQDIYNKVKAAVAEKERIIKKTEDDCDKIEVEIDKAREKYNNFKTLTKAYKVPDVMEYVDVKKRLDELKNNLKVWYRRKKIQDITLNACLRQMKNVTGSSKVERAWLEDLGADGTIDSSFDDLSTI